MIRRFAVFGNPVKHSRSPHIHQMFAVQFGHELQYDAIEIPAGQFAGEVRRLIEDGLFGANVTVPFKEDALAFSTQPTERATQAGAANTLFFGPDDIVADNTDGAGLVQDLNRLTGNIKGARVLLIGAGGATRGVVLPLLQAGVHNIDICNRTEAKSAFLATQFSQYGPVQSVPLGHIPCEHYDIIVNCTSSSLSGELPGISGHVFEKATLAYDMFYSDKATVFMAFASQCSSDIQVADGIGMLVGQAAESYRVWWGVSPDIDQVINQLRP